MQKANLTTKQSDQTETAECRVSIFHKRPMFEENVEFLSLYYAETGKDKQRLEKIFVNAFKRAHPSWAIKKVIVETKARVLK